MSGSILALTPPARLAVDNHLIGYGEPAAHADLKRENKQISTKQVRDEKSASGSIQKTRSEQERPLN